MTQLSDFMAPLIRGFRKQMDAKGLTDKSKIPAPKSCPKCKGLLPPQWCDKPFGHWRLGSTDDCAVCTNTKDDRRDEQRFEKSANRARVPMRLRALALVSLDPDRRCGELATACGEWDARRWLVASGGVGTGKTSWLTALLLDHLRANHKVKGLWTSEQRFYRKAQLHGDKSAGARERVVQEAVDADVLLLDDLGAGRRDLTEWQGGAMRDLLTERHLEGKPTLVTTNLTEDAIVKQYGDHVASRLVEASGGFINLGGADRRRARGNSFLAWWGR
jgi:DNA replication protein DnaC